MDVIKSEPGIDSLASRYGETNGEKEKRLSVAINMNGIKVEPSDLNYADLLEVKREENEDSSFLDVKFEIEEDSWIVGAVEEESTSDVMEKDDDLTQLPMQLRHNDDRIQEGEDLSARNLKKHKHTNLNAKSFKCSVCGKIFGEQSNLKMHEQSHKGRKPYKCKICGKNFESRQSLRDHSLTL
ncbi:uncharacterized protein [Periplaneta americana]|uniref:uncharacterized protein isoform X8 n=1 Tax=Periplaneta americana TaxID=6978 RepID=UPI0037E7E680